MKLYFTRDLLKLLGPTQESSTLQLTTLLGMHNAQGINITTCDIKLGELISEPPIFQTRSGGTWCLHWRGSTVITAFDVTVTMGWHGLSCNKLFIGSIRACGYVITNTNLSV